MLANQLKGKMGTKPKRVGRGGKTGTYCGRGGKGQSARKGFSQRATFEGGRTSIVSFSKKNRGFKTLREKALAVSLGKLNEKFSDGDQIDQKALLEKKMISRPSQPVKILSDGEVDKKFILKGLKVSQKGIKKIEKAGGRVEMPQAPQEKKKEEKGK